MKLRAEVLWFAEQMEGRLRRNDHKGGWGSLTDGEAEERLLDEFRELSGALHSPPIPATDENCRGWDRNIVAEAADVANFCMFIADNRKKSAEGLARGWKESHD